ncbi:hypothetical protein CDL12_13640 [Handroanthus impetiginosus]|uniref:Uncharacterized protein n=1 Tax=Handroanthus impetiginosus TaxID=429701 RepID=A0A2G9H898_9LAMI|nr:hypothetical protein CDL12_13640 [Handroanthus impetiginosus]
MRRYETADSCGYEFDYQADFRQFLEEARNQRTLNITNLEPALVNKQIDWQKKNRKSWKNSLFSWLKTDKRTKSTNQQTKGATIAKPRSGHASGPIQGTMSGLSTAQAKKPASGPLIGLFSSTRRAEEYEVPYMCLGQLNNPQKLHSYGPVYLVT